MLQSSSIIIFGEVLFDCFPDGSEVLGGAPFNVAWHLRGFGLSPCFISRVGTDAQGERIRASMEDWGLDASFLQTDPDHPTGRVRVMIENGEPSYDIVDGSAYDFIQSGEPGGVPTTGLLYHGSLALRHPASAAALSALKAAHRGSIFLDANLRSPWWSRELLLPLLDDADHVKLNEDELTLLSSGAVEEAEATALERVDGGLRPPPWPRDPDRHPRSQGSPPLERGRSDACCACFRNQRGRHGRCGRRLRLGLPARPQPAVAHLGQPRPGPRLRLGSGGPTGCHH